MKMRFRDGIKKGRKKDSVRYDMKVCNGREILKLATIAESGRGVSTIHSAETGGNSLLALS